MKYVYRPLRFYLTVYAATWLFWLLAILSGDGIVCTVFMLLGLLAPATVAVLTVFRSGSDALKADFRKKLVGFYRLRPKSILLAVCVFAAVVAASILLSTLFGQSLDQFAFTDDFSFSGAGVSSALLTILLASSIEELGWRGYGEDSIAQYCTWWKESLIFGVVWPLWHLPLLWVPGTYQYGLRELGLLYAVNFFVSGMPLGFLTTWVYLKNNRSMLANIIFHLFVNFMQERVAMTPETKCVETVAVFAAAAVVVLRNRDIFFETGHIGRLPDFEG
ncbi:MAG: CPBP family intramembrane metalloprotease [Oscillospiraceae bacterium]|nr:CPBP family intramembrane metalloprotease [Oscillospiraceae bacterium]